MVVVVVFVVFVLIVEVLDVVVVDWSLYVVKVAEAVVPVVVSSDRSS